MKKAFHEKEKKRSREETARGGKRGKKAHAFFIFVRAHPEKVDFFLSLRPSFLPSLHARFDTLLVARARARKGEQRGELRELIK
jgi:hypothetical protein